MVVETLSSTAERFRLVRFEMGSKKIVLGLGAGRTPMSTFSASTILRSHVVVGAIVVGLVRVEVTM